MNTLLKLALAGMVGAVAGAAGLGWVQSRHNTETPVAVAPATPTERKILYWHDPMTPGQRFDKPGKSPFMDMELVPVYADEASESEAGGVSISSRTQQNLGVRRATVERGAYAPQLAALGTVRFDETRTQAVQARVGGYIQRQNVRATNQPVSRGQVLAEILSPELVQAQEELLLALKLDDARLAEAARSRLDLLGFSAGQSRQLERSGQVQRTVALTAPQSGIVTEIAARPGMTVAAGAPLFMLSALDVVWVVAELPERDAGGVVSGSEALISFAALPGQTVRGRVEYVYPDVAQATRTASVRIALPNPQGRLRPGMLANVRFDAGAAREALWVPSEAVIQTGTRSVVIVAEAKGHYRAADVSLGSERDGRSEIRSGLEAGQQVVTSGQFLIDSEASLKGVLSRLQGSEPDTPPAPQGSEQSAPPAHQH